LNPAARSINSAGHNITDPRLAELAETISQEDVADRIFADPEAVLVATQAGVQFATALLNEAIRTAEGALDVIDYIHVIRRAGRGYNLLYLVESAAERSESIVIPAVIQQLFDIRDMSEGSPSGPDHLLKYLYMTAYVVANNLLADINAVTPARLATAEQVRNLLKTDEFYADVQRSTTIPEGQRILPMPIPTVRIIFPNTEEVAIVSMRRGDTWLSLIEKAIYRYHFLPFDHLRWIDDGDEHIKFDGKIIRTLNKTLTKKQSEMARNNPIIVE